MARPPLVFTFYIAAPIEKVWDGFVSKEANRIIFMGAEFAVEGTTGWRFLVEEIERAGQRAHLADPAQTAARRGRKRRAKTDNADCCRCPPNNAVR